MYLEVRRSFRIGVCAAATPTGVAAWFSKPLGSPLTSATGPGRGTGTGAGFLVNDALDETGTTVVELVVDDDAADEDAIGLEMAVPKDIAGRAGTGGIPAAANEALLLLRLVPYLGDGTWFLPWFESDILRLWLG